MLDGDCRPGSMGMINAVCDCDMGFSVVDIIFSRFARVGGLLVEISLPSIHHFTFEACSSFTHVTAYRVACPPKGGLLSRGFGPVSYPTEPLGSYHVSPTTTCVDPPSTGDLRRWGAPITGGYAHRAGAAHENGEKAHKGQSASFGLLHSNALIRTMVITRPEYP